MESIAPLLDRLGNKLGLAALSRSEAHESHIPERASVRVPIGVPIDPSVAPAKSGVQGQPGRRAGSSPDLIRGSCGNDEIRPPRPVRLFAPPQPIEALWLLPDDPPFRFTWRRLSHRVTRADGPERIAEEWWRAEGPAGRDAIRDYYRVEDEDGRRFWLFRAGLAGHDDPPRWFIHGLFA